MSALQPSFVLRGHATQIHSVQFVRQNTRLLTGDGDGYVVCWKLESKRPVALRIADEPLLSAVLPADGSTTHRPKPWLLHSLPVNTLNFCAFAVCSAPHGLNIEPAPGHASAGASLSESIIVAVPARDDKTIDVYQFPDERLLCVVPRVQHADTGMVMAVKLLHHSPSDGIYIIAGYESGYTAVHFFDPRSPPQPHQAASVMPDLARTIYLSQPHTQPILSLDALPDASVYFTSSADAVIAAHRVPDPPPHVLSPPNRAALGAPESTKPVDHMSESSPEPLPTENRNLAAHPPVQEMQAATASPLTFSKQSVSPSAEPPTSAGLSLLLASVPSQETIKPAPPFSYTLSVQPPYKATNTKHAGQQSLRVRSDGRILATAGWDSKVRVYSTKSLKELAVLKWHAEGVYAVDFAQLLDPVASHDPQTDLADSEGKELVSQNQTKLGGLGRLQQQREERARLKHWVAAGAKDAKVSLWEVF
ncbi:WD40 repeat-like protein [Polyplosphaeria fusca]|uniref:ASTRA-associated protein 1 n=1 Tax=Polyplosphaeria fusca TaxID=682080 RepID=A0A9P4R8F7_9PLEO|nr:WD40 repeat-like protein [Polyplosphaeria fusca]